MSSPTNESYRRDSLDHLIPNVELIQEFYNVAQKQGKNTILDIPAKAKQGANGGLQASCSINSCRCWRGMVNQLNLAYRYTIHTYILYPSAGSHAAQPALFKRLADILEFCLAFDTLKVLYSNCLLLYLTPERLLVGRP